MRFANQTVVKCVAVCSLILALTSAAKIYGLLRGGGLLVLPHPFLPGAFETYIWLGLVVELMAFVILWYGGSRAFLTFCLGLAILFVGYHGLEVGLKAESRCPCLGGLLSHFKLLTKSESALSFLLACIFGLASFVGLFPVLPRKMVDPPADRSSKSTLIAMTVWLVLALGVIWFWRDRILGGDEGMEAAKSLQLLVRPHDAARMWNDQSPLLSILAATVFRFFGPSMSGGRTVVVLLGVLLPLVWSVYWSREGRTWAALLSVILLWLAVPDYFSSFMLEAPAYSVGTVSLLPLLFREKNCVPLIASACIGSLALLLKLTAAFALVVPFIWLLQRNRRHAVIWGFGVIGLTALGSLILPGWSWADMRASHLNFASNQIWQYRFDAGVYAQAWLVCLLAAYAVANRYVKAQLQPVVPWLSAAIIAVLIHLLHRPFWSYYVVHLVTPVAVLAGVGVFDFWQWLTQAPLPVWERRLLAAGETMLCLLWFWQREAQITNSYRSSTLVAKSPITARLRSLGESGHAMFSMNPLWTFAAGQVQTPSELTVVPLKRVWSGQISDTAISNMLWSNRVDAIVLGQHVLKQPAWTNLLANYLPTARDGVSILFERRELNPRPIDLKVESETKVELGRLGL